jgi:dipeptidase
MNIRHAMLGAVLALTATAFADVDWMILPKYSRSGRMLVHGARYGVSKDGKKPVRIVPKQYFITPQTDKAAKYNYLRLGSICGLNEKGLAVIWSSGNPTRDKNPKKKNATYASYAATAAILRSCATAEQAVKHMRRAVDKRLVSGSSIFLVADPKRAFVIECAPKHFASWELPHAFCVYSNCWKLPGMDDASVDNANRATSNFQREWAAREALRQALTEKKSLSVADSIRASRLSVAEVNDKEFSKLRGWLKLTSAPFNRFSADSYLFELDCEFPAELSCVYAALGPQRHTVYLPISFGAADQLPKVLSDKEWSANAWRIADAAKPEDPVRPELLEFENKQIADFAKVREEARWLLRLEKREEALKLLHDTLTRQSGETLEFLKKLE